MRIDNKTVLQGFRTAGGSQDFKEFYKGLQGSRSEFVEASDRTAQTYLMIRRFDGAVGAVAAGWLTPTITPPTVNTAERAVVPVLAVIVYVALPEPVLPPVMVAHV